MPGDNRLATALGVIITWQFRFAGYQKYHMVDWNTICRDKSGHDEKADCLGNGDRDLDQWKIVYS